MRKRLIRLSGVSCSLLCVVVLLWLQRNSYRTWRVVDKRTESGRQIAARSADGVFEIRIAMRLAPGEGFFYHSSGVPEHTDWSKIEYSDFVGIITAEAFWRDDFAINKVFYIGHSTFGIYRGTYMGTEPTSARCYAIQAPHWFFAIPFCFWPAWRVPAILRRRIRRSSGLCVTCGYNLAANATGSAPNVERASRLPAGPRVSNRFEREVQADQRTNQSQHFQKDKWKTEHRAHKYSDDLKDEPKSDGAELIRPWWQSSRSGDRANVFASNPDRDDLNHVGSRTIAVRAR
jgi:hypothetical protein